MQMLQVAYEIVAAVATNKITAHHLIECGNHKWLLPIIHATNIYTQAQHIQMCYLSIVLSLRAQLLFTVILLQQTITTTKDNCIQLFCRLDAFTCCLRACQLSGAPCCNTRTRAHAVDYRRSSGACAYAVIGAQ